MNLEICWENYTIDGCQTNKKTEFEWVASGSTDENKLVNKYRAAEPDFQEPTFQNIPNR